MLIWIIFAIMTGAAVFALIWPLGRAQAVAFSDVADATSLYTSQLGEIERDLRRRLIGTSEAEAARNEAARRLLRSTSAESEPAGETETSLRRRRASSALALSCVPLLALLVYGAFGSPETPDQPLAARLQGTPSQQDFAIALSRIETHLAANPTDAKGWALLAPIYLRQGRYDDAVRAFGAVLRNGPPDAETQAGLGEARILAAGGVVTAAAREDLAQAVRLDPANPRARFFLALAKEQDGDAPGAIVALRDLLAQATPDAAWAEPVRQRLARMEADAAGKDISALPASERNAAINAMVEGLAERLKQGGGTAQDWARLIRSQKVLGNEAAARETLATARLRLAGDGPALTEIDALAAELGLKGDAP